MKKNITLLFVSTFLLPAVAQGLDWPFNNLDYKTHPTYTTQIATLPSQEASEDKKTNFLVERQALSPDIDLWESAFNKATKQQNFAVQCVSKAENRLDGGGWRHQKRYTEEVNEAKDFLRSSNLFVDNILELTNTSQNTKFNTHTPLKNTTEDNLNYLVRLYREHPTYTRCMDMQNAVEHAVYKREETLKILKKAEDRLDGGGWRYKKRYTEEVNEAKAQLKQMNKNLDTKRKELLIFLKEMS